MESEDIFAQNSEEISNQISESIGVDNVNKIHGKDVDVNAEKITINTSIIDEIMEEKEEDENINEPDKTEIIEKQGSSSAKSKTQDPKLIQLPLSKIKSIMKLDPDLHMVSTEGVFCMAKATELFIESLAKMSYSFTEQSKKKTIQKRDVESAISCVDSLMFLEGCMNFEFSTKND